MASPRKLLVTCDEVVEMGVELQPEKNCPGNRRRDENLGVTEAPGSLCLMITAKLY